MGFLEGESDNKQALIQDKMSGGFPGQSPRHVREADFHLTTRVTIQQSLSQPSLLVETATVIPLHTSHIEVGWRPSSDRGKPLSQ